MYSAWFPGKVKPARPGVYRVKVRGGACYYARFNGTRWLQVAPTIEVANGQIMGSMILDAPFTWQGLSHDPAAQ